MNHHTDKMVYVEGCGPVHEVLEEFYRCPNCGAAAARVPGQGEQGSS
ncbi:MAG TPA: hypothetical protein VMD98_04690 [Bryocella sp.]|nr:hypothetical protein [Bryocella sp.]